VKLRRIFFAVNLLLAYSLFGQYQSATFSQEGIDNLYRTISKLNFGEDNYLLLGVDKNTADWENNQWQAIGLKLIDDELSLSFETTILDTFSQMYPVSGELHFLNNDELIIFGIISSFPIEAPNLFNQLFYCRYSLSSNEILDYKVFETGYVDAVLSKVLHSDGYFYLSGRRSNPTSPQFYDWLIMKIDQEGNLIWDKAIPTAPNTRAYLLNLMEIDENTIGAFGWYVTDVIDYESIVNYEFVKLDTSGEVTSKRIFEDSNYYFIKSKFYNNHIYTIGQYDTLNRKAPFLACYDLQFNTVWDTVLMQDYADYDIVLRDLDVFNDELYILGSCRALNGNTDNKAWGYLSNWNLQGTSANWERLYVYDSLYYYHYLEDMVQTADNDIILAGWCTTNRIDDYNQLENDVLLIKTDEDGCGVYDECNSTIPSHFLISSIAELNQIESNNFQLLNNKTKNIALLNNKSNDKPPFQLRIISPSGAIHFTDEISQFPYTINTQSFPIGLYTVIIINENNEAWNGKLFKY